MSIKIIKKNIEQHLSVINKLDDNFQSLILSVSQIMSETLRNGNTIFWCGNGGSASDSQHLAAELVGRYDKERKPLRSISLTSDSSTLTCIANDYSFNNIFSRQLEGLAKEGDMVVGISTSGNSANIINVFKTAKTLKVKSLALLGKDGGAALGFCDEFILVPSNITARVQETHILIGHLLCLLIEDQLNL